MLKILNKENKKVICQMGNFCVVWEIPLEPQAIIQTKVFLWYSNQLPLTQCIRSVCNTTLKVAVKSVPCRCASVVTKVSGFSKQRKYMTEQMRAIEPMLTNDRVHLFRKNICYHWVFLIFRPEYLKSLPYHCRVS